MSEIIQLRWNLKTDLYAFSVALSSLREIDSLRILAMLLYEKGICQNITINSVDGTFLEDWSTGQVKSATQLFNEQMKIALGDKDERM